MVMDVDSANGEYRQKVLVCITAQSNSKRLIEKGAYIADGCNGELHILHVLKGNNVFSNHETLRLLQQLFLFGSEKGAMIHAYCDDNVSDYINVFVKNEGITKLVLGEPPEGVVKKNKKHCENQFHKIQNSLEKQVQVIIVKREEKEQKLSFQKSAIKPVI